MLNLKITTSLTEIWGEKELCTYIKLKMINGQLISFPFYNLSFTLNIGS